MSSEPTPAFTTPELAQQAFYEALENTDFATMMHVWAEHDDIVCVHPMGELLRGRAAVAYSWGQILNTPGRLKFEVAPGPTYATDTMCVQHVHEVIRHGRDFAQITMVVATNIFHLEAGGWRMVAHHASLHPEIDSGDPGSSEHMH